MASGIIFILSIISLIYVLYPFFSNQQDMAMTTPKEKLLELEDSKFSIYSTLRDMEFDFSTGKLTKEDFEQSWKHYKNNAINIIKEIEKVKIKK